MNEKNDNLWANVHQASKIYLLPNFFTAGNLFFGFVSIMLCIHGRFDPVESEVQQLSYLILPSLKGQDISYSYFLLAIVCILMSVFCDALDGRVARASGRSSLFGKEFDSIADAISFGVAPCLLTYLMILKPMAELPESIHNFMNSSGWIVGFIYLLCACVRLSRFNVLTCPYIVGHEKYEKGDFCGLPAPGAAGAVSSIALTLMSLDLKEFALLLIPLMLLISFFMVSNIPYPSFKHINWNLSARFRTFVIIIACILIIILLKEYSFSVIFLSYVFYPPLKYAPKMFKIVKYISKRKKIF